MDGDIVFTDYQINDAGEKMLPTYCGYTVDVAARTFYRVKDNDLENISFESGGGSIMVFELLELLPRDSRLYQKLSELSLTEEDFGRSS
jgi:hypothetical protein